MHADRPGDCQESGNDEHGDMNPSPVSIAQKAECVTPQIEPGTGDHLDHSHQDIDWSGKHRT